MTGSKKASLQRRFADAGISTEGTKKDLTVRLKSSKSVIVVGAIIYHEPVAPPTQGTWRSNDYVSAVRLVDA